MSSSDKTKLNGIATGATKDTYTDYEVTIGTTLYNGWYYGDKTITAGNGVKSLMILTAASNTPCFAIRLTSTSIRVFSYSQNCKHTVRVVYFG